MYGLAAYDDPAFSSDPHAHPYFSTPWSLKPDDGPRLRQSPNGPMLSDDHSSATHESSSSSNHSSTTLSTPPTSTESHSASWTPTSEKMSHLQWPPEVQKKKKTLAMFWRRTPPETVLASVDLIRNVSPDYSPPRNMIPNRRPAPARNVTAPNVDVSSSRPKLPRRPATSPTDIKSPPQASRRTAGGLAMRGSKLDRIDELDESNPIGQPLHHGGPYEAVHNSTDQQIKQGNVPHNAGSLYQLPIPKSKQDKLPDRKQERIPRSHRRNLSDVTSVPIVPAGVSLNLSPGQILPHDFYRQVDSRMAATTAPSDAPGWPPKPHYPHYQHGRSQSQPQYRQYFSPSQNISTNHNDHQQAQFDSSLPHNAPPEYSALPRDHYVAIGSPGHPVSFTPPIFNYEREELSYDLDDRKYSTKLVKEQQHYTGPPVNILLDPRAPTPGPRHHHQNQNRLPPRMQALQMQIPRSDEKQRRSSRPSVRNHDYVVGGTIPIQAGHFHQPFTPPMVDNDRQVPLFVDNNGLPASAPVAPSFEILHAMQDHVLPNDILQPLPGLDNGPGWQIHNRTKSNNSGYPRGAPPPHHLPKRLVMPAPLETTQPFAPRRQSQLKPPPRHLGHHTWQPQLCPPSPPAIPAALDPYIERQLRAEDIQMSQSRKLRKRSSDQAVPQPTLPSHLPSQHLSFEPTLTYHDVPSHQPSSIRKSDKYQRKVLSKRRIEF